jgi:antitoxin component YwqK of YwqJK toxin-antitoxin module
MFYAHDQKTGTWKMWDEKGLLTAERTYSEAE